jgi:hypothetical protein
MYISENKTAPELGGWLDTVTDAISWTVDTAKSLSTVVSGKTTTAPKTTTKAVAPAPAPAPAPSSAVATGMKIGLPVLALGGVALYFILKKK